MPFVTKGHEWSDRLAGGCDDDDDDGDILILSLKLNMRINCPQWRTFLDRITKLNTEIRTVTI